MGGLHQPPLTGRGLTPAFLRTFAIACVLLLLGAIIILYFLSDFLSMLATAYEKRENKAVANIDKKSLKI